MSHRKSGKNVWKISEKQYREFMDQEIDYDKLCSNALRKPTVTYYKKDEGKKFWTRTLR